MCSPVRAFFELWLLFTLACLTSPRILGGRKEYGVIHPHSGGYSSPTKLFQEVKSFSYEDGDPSVDKANVHTGGYGEQFDILAASKPTGNTLRYTNQDDAVKIDSRNAQPYVPTSDDIHNWKLQHEKKQHKYFRRYKMKEAHKSDKLYKNEDFSTVEGFQPERHFSLPPDLNVSKTDIGSLDYTLLSGKGSVDYNTLSRTPHGRHLLLITLLEGIGGDYWKPRCNGKLKFYLPKSLKSPSQPKPADGSIVLRDIILKGKVIPRKRLLQSIKKLPFGSFDRYEHVSRFNSSHLSAVSSMTKLALSQETFDSTLSLLVTLGEVVNPRIFIEVVLAVIDSRDDVGFVKPSLITVQPFDYFPIQSFTKHKADEMNKMNNQTNHIIRHKRQIFPGMQFGPMNMNMMGMQGMMGQPPVWRINWGDGPFRTLPASDPESWLWYFREDPMVNSHHYFWHLKLSNREVPSWHPSHGLNIDRRGEMFCFMHKQMLARYNADRIALGLPLTTALSREEWTRGVLAGYDSRLTEATGRPYPARPSGAFIPNTQALFMADNALRNAIRTGLLQTRMGPVRLGYGNGVDYGISPLGDAVEAFEQDQATGNLHNDGHEAIGRMHGFDGMIGVMGNPNVAVRDPIFFRWHKNIDDLIVSYKMMLPPYTDIELGFPGIEITAAHVMSERGGVHNTLYTYMDSASISLSSIDFEGLGSGRSVNINYDRLNHVPFTYHVNIQSQFRVHGLLRIFLLPANVRLPAHTDVTQVAIEMDRFLISMNPGENYFTRHSSRSPFVAKSSLPIGELQNRLLQGMINQDEFNWSGCGWPENMILPRGREGGMAFRMYIMVSQVLPGDRAMTANWERMRFISWSWCGVRRNEGDVPDNRPMGFPLDRPPPNGNWQSLMYSGGRRRGNHYTFNTNIFYDPVGTTNRRRTTG